MPVSNLAQKIAAAPRRHDNDYPLWQGPCGAGSLGGITQSMLVRFLSCRERFRLKYVLGLEPSDRWNKNIGYGNMWHACEEGLASVNTMEPCGRTPLHDDPTTFWHACLLDHTQQQLTKYPLQQEEITKWHKVCHVQFPEYIQYWADHSDVKNRTPLLQEQVFDVPYSLPSGRLVRLRGKWDSVDLITDPEQPQGIYLQENKTKGDIDKLQVERQLKFDLQTMLYLITLERIGDNREFMREIPVSLGGWPGGADLPILGVRYNVVRRPLSGGVGNIKPHIAKATKTKVTPAETEAQFYERLRRDYIAADPAHWFFRVRVEISAHDIQVFRETCLDPLLEQICWWYEEIILQTGSKSFQRIDDNPPPMNYRTPFGVYSALEEGGATEYDAYLSSGSEAGLRRIETMFTELQ